MEQTSWKLTSPTKKEKATTNLKAETKPFSLTSHSQGNDFAPTHNRDIKYFKCQGKGHIASQCPNKRVIGLRDDGEIETEDKDNTDPIATIEGC